MALTIRSAGRDDAETILAFIRELAAYEREPQAVETSAAILAQQLASPRPPFECLLAEEGRAAQGFALYFHNYSTWRGRPGLYLEDLYVRPEHRRRGVGLALLKELARLARERGCARMEWAVLDWNKPAIDFYLKLGAVPLAEWTTFRLDGEQLRRLAEE